MITLRRRIRVQSYEAFVHYMHPNKSREDILSFLTLVNEREVIDAKSVNHDFFMKQADGHCFGQRYIISIAALGLIEPALDSGPGQYRLTDLGSRAVEEGEVFIPASESLMIHLTDDPLFDYSLLSLGDDKMEGGPKNSASKEPMNDSGEPVEKPEIVRAIESNKPHRLWAMKGERVIVNGVDKFVTPSKRSMKVTVEIQVDMERALRALIAVGDEKAHQVDIDANIEYIDVMQEAANRTHTEMDVGGTELILTYDETKPEERASFLRILPKMEIDMGELGKFEATWNSGVAIRPHDPDDAAKWIDEAILSSITGFIDKDGYESIRAKIIARFTIWFSGSHLDGLVLTYNEMVRRLRSAQKGEKEVQWYVMAPIDLIGGV